MTDEEYVRAHWERVCMAWGDCGPCSVILLDTDGDHYTFDFDDSPEAWAAAAYFTRERLEQIRQLRSELGELEPYLIVGQEWPHIFMSHTNRALVHRVRLQHRQARTIARLESALADLKRGMKAPSPAQAGGQQ